MTKDTIYQFERKVVKGAEIRGNYRYTLSREWDPKREKVLFIGLNPSIADAIIDDRTITRCMRFADSWGYGGILMANLFAYRATNPRVLKKVKDPVGPDNDRWLAKLSKQAGKAIAVWGNQGIFMGRNKIVCGFFKNLHCLDLTQSGHPHHPRGLSCKCIPRKYKAV